MAPCILGEKVVLKSCSLNSYILPFNWTKKKKKSEPQIQAPNLKKNDTQILTDTTSTWKYLNQDVIFKTTGDNIILIKLQNNKFQLIIYECQS